MKIGIITFWETQDNYGQVLQCYALQTFLKKMGHEPYLIRYSLFDDHTGYPGRWKSVFSIKKILLFVNKKIKKMVSPHPMKTTDHSRSFDVFKKQYIKATKRKYRSLKELRRNPPQAEVYICGSDQIWYAPDNYAVYKNITRAYFLDFGAPEVIRIAYAPSFGRADYPQGYCDYIAPLLQNFQLVTVRETGGVKVCAQAGRKDAIQVPDPTCLIDKITYLNISKSPNASKKYILLYLLGSKDDGISMPTIYNYAKANGFEVKYIASQGRRGEFDKIYPTVNEWLGLMANAELTITNSFHGSVFSIIFNRQFIALPIGGYKRDGGNDRLFTLCENLNITDRIYNDNFSDLVNKSTDYLPVNEILSQCRNEITLLLSKYI